MLTLPDITLCCIDGKNFDLALRALVRSRRSIEFGRTVFLTDTNRLNIDVPDGIEVIPIGAINSHEAYSRIVLKELCPYIETSHVLLIQWDGYVVHAESWSDDFLNYDYIGAPWPDGKGGYVVGNGGFSLRSRKLLEALQDARFSGTTKTEDVTLCGHYRSDLEQEFGVQFAPPEVASRFSFELDARPVQRGAKTFGFHGIFNLFAVEGEREIAELAPRLSESNAKSQMTLFLMENLVKFELFAAAVAIGNRILECDPENEAVASELVRAREGLSGETAKMEMGFAARLVRKLRGAY